MPSNDTPTLTDTLCLSAILTRTVGLLQFAYPGVSVDEICAEALMAATCTADRAAVAVHLLRSRLHLGVERYATIGDFDLPKWETITAVARAAGMFPRDLLTAYRLDNAAMTASAR